MRGKLTSFRTSLLFWLRDICIRTGSVTTCGRSFYRTLLLRARTAQNLSVGLRLWHATRSCSLSDFRVPIACLDSRNFILAGDEVFRLFTVSIPSVHVCKSRWLLRVVILVIKWIRDVDCIFLAFWLSIMCLRSNKIHTALYDLSSSE